MSIFRRCGCRTDDGRQYGALPDSPTEKQIERACPLMLEDPKHGRWSFRLSAGFDPVTKKRVQVNGGTFDTKREAQKARNEAAVKVDRGTFVAPSRETFAEYLPKWLERAERTGRGLKPRTVEEYARYINNDLVPSTLGAMRLTDIRRHHINTFIQMHMDAGRGTVAIRRMIAVVQGALRAATIDEKIPENPATMLKLPRVDKKHFEPWEPSEVGTFLDAASAHRLGALFETAVFTGLRRGELVNLHWSDVDLITREVRVGDTKTDAGRRRVPLNDRAAESLGAWQILQGLERADLAEAWVDTGRVFTYADGRELKPQYVTRLFDKLRRTTQLPVMTMHGLRHEYASLNIAAGTPLAVLSKWMGHSSITVTVDLYSHLLRAEAHAAANAAGALVPARTTPARTVHAHAPGDAEGAALATRENSPSPACSSVGLTGFEPATP